MSRSGHLWTIWPFLRYRWVKPPISTPWSTRFEDPKTGSIQISGKLSVPAQARDLVVIVHGLGGSSESYYAVLAARAAAQRGLASLRVNLRGADRSGVDVYHGGLTLDLHRTLADPAFERFDSISLLGYSMGGHVSLRYAAEGPDRRLRGVVAVCSPLDMALSAASFDDRTPHIYKHVILRALRDRHRRLASNTELPLSVNEMRAVRGIGEWDARLIAPRFGFADAADYYARASVAPVMHELGAPSLLIASQHDPIIHHDTIHAAVERPVERLRIVDVKTGGHCGFPPSLQLGFDPRPGLAHQALGWLEKAPSGARTTDARPAL